MKTIKKQLRRAFTIVELVIVIAVIAALAAILIPTFVNVIQSANESADMQMLANINKVLATENILNKIETPEQALDVAETAGYNIENLTPTSDGNYVVYDETTTSFALVDSDGNTVYSVDGGAVSTDEPSTWYFASSQNEIQKQTVSYIITGTWNSDLVYNGTGGLDTSRATIQAGVVAGVENSTASTGYTAVSAKKTASDNANGDNYTVVFNLTNVVGFYYIYPATAPEFVMYFDGYYSFPENQTPDATSYKVVGTAVEGNVKYEEVKNEDGTTSKVVTIEGLTVSEVYASLSSESTESAVLQFGNAKYPYLVNSSYDFANGFAKDGIYQLTESFESSSAITISESSEITLDLNGYSISQSTNNATITVNSGATLTIKDSSADKKGTISNTNTGTNKYAINNSGDLIVNSGNISGGYGAITGTGIVTVNGSTISGGTYGINISGGSLVVNSGATVTASTSYAINASNSAVVATINGGTITNNSTSKGAISTRGTITINGGTISSPYYGVEVNKNGNLVISENSTAEITGTNTGITNSNGEVTVNGGTVTGTNNYGIYAKSGTIEINGGNISGGKYAVYLQDTATATIKDGTFVGGTTYGLMIYSDTVTATISDSVSITKIGKDDAELGYTAGEVAGTTVYTLGWNASNAYVYNSTQSTYFETLTNAMNNAASEDTIQLLKDYTGSLVSSKNVTIDLNGHNWTYRSVSESSYLLTISSDNTVTLTNTGSTQSTISFTALTASSTVAVPAIDNHGTLSITGNISIVATGSVAGDIDGIFAQSTSTTTIETGVSINATNSGSGIATGIVCWGTNVEDSYTNLTINGGSIYGGTYGVDGNGSKSYTNVTINGGEIEGGAVGYYHPEIGTLTITDGSITGYYAGLQVCAGTINISGGTFTATIANPLREGDNVYQKTGDGAIADGAALSIINRSGYGTYESTECSVTSVEISNGTFVSASGIEAVQFYTFTNSDTDISALDSDQSIVTITGGEFSSALTGDYSAYCVDTTNYEVASSTQTDGYYTVREKTTA